MSNVELKPPAKPWSRSARSGYCVAIAPGCSSNLRYLTTEGGTGDCVDLPMCIAPDMQSPAVPVDFSMPPVNGDM